MKGWNDAWSYLYEGDQWGTCVFQCLSEPDLFTCLHNTWTCNVYVCPLVYLYPCHGFVLVWMLLNLHAVCSCIYPQLWLHYFECARIYCSTPHRASYPDNVLALLMWSHSFVIFLSVYTAMGEHSVQLNGFFLYALRSETRMSGWWFTLKMTGFFVPVTDFQATSLCTVHLAVAQQVSRRLGRYFMK